MDYMDYINNQIQKEYELADEMERLGIETEEEYIDYIETKKADFQEAMMESRRFEEEF